MFVVSPQEDCLILSARSELDALDQMLDQQQRQLADRVSASSDILDAAIPVTFTKVKRLVFVKLKNLAL